ncbi:hypothetical protein DACRYDRAFT_99538 [Dacryopinax primogenitus]|uniref:DUF221-domain-containing protein n=1 Tax=Dacryopinax primogenitus (strain DJM 731) TaxID=1858805 RepID=M5G4R0_DACPD|nr:uncharacterized protein DACRYDRAFT_99538 [Dacryopinax primogenitus]EJU03200.1 hypothetical protein DACRYDRAFT_99538 [Dacryopinax primogenitus]
MTTVNDRSTYSGLYSGLANNAVFAVIVSGVGLTVFESLRRVRAHTNRPDVKQSKLGGPLGSVETWEFGYFYMARSWSLHPPPILKAIPLSWIWPTLRYSEHNLPALTRSLDAVVHVRYLTASFLFALLHTCTSLPILLVIHLLFNPSDILPGSMNKASLQYLVTSDRFLWVHVVILFWLTGTWIWALIWLTRGALRYRHEVIVDSYNRAAQSTPSADMKKFRGRRFRTVMIENIPVYMRSEEALKNYFERYLAMPSLRAAFLQRGWLGWWGVIRNQLIRDLEPLPLDEEAQEHGDMPKVEQVVFARKTTELQALLEQREVLLGKLEALHVKLASNVLAAVAARLAAKEHASIESPTAEKFARKPRLIGGLQTNSSLDKLVEALGPFAKAFSQEKIQSPPLPVTGDTIWEALYRVPPELLHPYQPLIRMKPRYTGRMDVAIDYYALKLATVDKQIEEERAIDEAKREPSTTAFVTFVAPHHARKAFRFLAFNPRSPDTCFVTPAPDPSDIIWKRATRPNFRGAFLRDLLVSIGVWTFTLLWVPPVCPILLALRRSLAHRMAFPAAAPFFVGGASTLRKRAQATKPRVYDYSYWLPTHMLVLLIMHVFAILNPLVIPFCLIYLAFEFVIVKHQKMQVFSRAFETNGFNINHRILRFSCDGLVFSQVIFLVLMIIIKKVGEAVLTGLLILATIMVKLYLSRKCKTAYGAADKLEADWICSTGSIMPTSQHRHELPSIASRETLPLYGPRVDNVITSLGQLAEATVHTADDNLTNEVEHPCMSTTALDAADENPIVTAHPTTAKWDDSVPYDASYENPLYTTSLDKFMWLPRNPLARLDLDDGVRIHVVLLSRPDRNWRGVGRLPRELEAQLFGDIPGTRPSGEVLLTDHDSQSYEPRSSITQEPLLKPNVRLTRDDALEEIELPPILAARVQHPEQETDIEEVEGTTLQERIRPPLSRARSFKSQASKQPSLRHTSSAENWFPGHIMREEPNELGIPPLSTVGLPETSSDGALPVIGLGGEESRISSTPGNTHGSALSSFRALANLVMREARQEKEDREKKDKKEDESRNPRSSLAQILDAHGRVNE